MMWAEPRFASRLPESIKERIRQHGLRNSHLLSIAPTGTISLAFADNASNGIEPPFSWFYNRTVAYVARLMIHPTPCWGCSPRKVTR